MNVQVKTSQFTIAPGVLEREAGGIGTARDTNDTSAVSYHCSTIHTQQTQTKTHTQHGTHTRHIYRFSIWLEAARSQQSMRYMLYSWCTNNCKRVSIEKFCVCFLLLVAVCYIENKRRLRVQIEHLFVNLIYLNTFTGYTMGTVGSGDAVVKHKDTEVCGSIFLGALIKKDA